MKKQDHSRRHHLVMLHEMEIPLEMMLEIAVNAYFWCPKCKHVHLRDEWINNLKCPSKKCNGDRGVLWENFAEISRNEQKPHNGMYCNP